MINILSSKLESLLTKCNIGQPRARECFECLLNVGITEQQIIDTFIPINSYNGSFEFDISLLDLLSEKWNLLTNQKIDDKCTISDLKKKIKYCKNPMEKRRLEKEINKLYKSKK